MWAFLILLPASIGGRELSRFEESRNVDSEAEVPLEISWRAGSRVKRENKVNKVAPSLAYFQHYLNCRKYKFCASGQKRFSFLLK